MALPTAQLGQMASLNVPTGRQVAYTQKNPKLWEQALMQILTGAAMEAGKTGVQNVMSQDYAPEFGQTPASTFKRMLQGPTVDTRTAGQLRSEAGADKRQKVSGEQNIALEENRSNNDMRRQEQQQTFAAGENKENRVADFMRLLTSEGGAERRAQTGDAAAERRLRMQIEAGAGENSAQTNLLNKQAMQIEELIKFNKAIQERLENTPDAKTGLTPRQAAERATPTTPRQKMIQDAANDPTRYGEYGRVHAGSAPAAVAQPQRNRPGVSYDQPLTAADIGPQAPVDPRSLLQRLLPGADPNSTLSFALPPKETAEELYRRGAIDEATYLRALQLQSNP